MSIMLRLLFPKPASILAKTATPIAEPNRFCTLNIVVALPIEGGVILLNAEN